VIKVFGYLTRKPGLSPQEFADYYERNHVPLVLSKAAMPPVYKRNYSSAATPSTSRVTTSASTA
jgi:EthD domain